MLWRRGINWQIADVSPPRSGGKTRHIRVQRMRRVRGPAPMVSHVQAPPQQALTRAPFAERERHAPSPTSWARGQLSLRFLRRAVDLGSKAHRAMMARFGFDDGAVGLVIG